MEENKTFFVRLSYLQPVEVNGYVQFPTKEAAETDLLRQGKENGHIDVRVLELDEVDGIPIPEELALEPTLDKKKLN